MSLLLLLLGCPPPDAPPEAACVESPGAVCTWAGTGDAGFDGDGLHRLESWFYFPIDVELSALGKPAVNDWNNHRIRVVEDDGTLLTVMGTDFVGDGDPDQADKTEAGAPGTTVNLNHPTDALYLPDGTLLSASWHTHKLRTLDPATGTVRVHCGDTPGFAGDDGESAEGALFNQPKAVELDDDGTIYVLDMRNQRVRALTPDFRIDTLAGTGEKGFSGDDGPADAATFAFPDGPNPRPGGGLARDGRTLYVADTENHRIRAVDLDTRVVTTVAGTGEPGWSGDGGPAVDARFQFPTDIEVAGGVLWVADTDNHVVRAIDLATGTVDTVIGTGEAGFSGDGGPAADAALSSPYGVEVDDDGRLYVSDTFNHRIRVVYP